MYLGHAPSVCGGERELCELNTIEPPRVTISHVLEYGTKFSSQRSRVLAKIAPTVRTGHKSGSVELDDYAAIDVYHRHTRTHFGHRRLQRLVGLTCTDSGLYPSMPMLI